VNHLSILLPSLSLFLHHKKWLGSPYLYITSITQYESHPIKDIPTSLFNVVYKVPSMQPMTLDQSHTTWSHMLTCYTYLKSIKNHTQSASVGDPVSVIYFFSNYRRHTFNVLPLHATPSHSVLSSLQSF
jgi:hypothetical protein